MWMQVDSATLQAGPSHDGARTGQQALAWAEDLNYAGHGDWRLPNAKELQSIVDYTRSPDTTGSAAIDPVFDVTPIKNEGGQPDFPCYWTSTTHASVDRRRRGLRRVRPGARLDATAAVAERPEDSCWTSTAPARSAATRRAAIPPTFRTAAVRRAT